jgi:hypothetical protein
MNDYYGTENYGPAGPPEGNKSSATTEPELIDDERYARAVANQGKQVTALSMRCAELESERAALEAENARLREALGALVDAETHGIPSGYIGVYPDETDRYCTYCLTSWRMGEPERHDDDCPIAAARELLEGGA